MKALWFALQLVALTVITIVLFLPALATEFAHMFFQSTYDWLTRQADRLKHDIAVWKEER